MRKFFKALLSVSLCAALLIGGNMTVLAEGTPLSSSESVSVSTEPFAKETAMANTFAKQIKDDVVYNYDALTLENLPDYIAQNTLEKSVTPVGLDDADNDELFSFTTINSDGTNTLYLFNDPVKFVDKYNIIIDKYTGINVFKFYLDVGGAYPVYTEGEAIPFADPDTDEIIFIIGQVDAKDSYAGEETDGHFTLYNSLKVEKSDGRYILTVTVDKDFLEDPDTVYPVLSQSI